jgi:hypothetical protein
LVVLSRKLHVAVRFNSAVLDAACAGVADRLRKQAKTRAVKIVREAIADPACGASMRVLRGHAGAQAPSLHLDKYITSRTNFIGADRSRSYVVFDAKHKGTSAAAAAAAASPAQTCASAACKPSAAARPTLPLATQAALSTSARPACAPPASGGALPSRTAMFPVSLFVTAIGEGALARDISRKMRDRLELVRRSLPHTAYDIRIQGALPALYPKP